MTLKRKIQKRDSYLLAVLLNLAIILVMGAVLKIYPFGSNELCFSDGDQYFGFYAMYQRALLSGENLLYTWSMALGGNAMAEAAYYCMSPFNLLLALFPGDLMLGVHVIVVLKLLCAGLTFCMLLNYADREHYLEKALFSVAYAHMGYVAAYIWNSSWLDGVLILPLILLGILRLVREKKCLLYILSLGFVIFSNFYIGFMVCISSVIFYAAYLTYSAQGFWKGFRGSFLRYAVSSLLGGMLSMPVLLTILLNMPEGRRMPLGQIVEEMHPNLTFENILSMLNTGSMDPKLYSKNLPVIFIGIIFTVLLALYFFNNGISIRKKLVALALLAGFGCFFHNSTINIVWHGFSGNFWFNYRYSFVASFLMLLLAYDSYRNLGTLKVQDFWHTAVFLVLVGLMVRNTDNYSARRIILAYADLILAGLTLGGCWLLITKGEKRAWVLRGMCVLMCLNILVNDFISLRGGPGSGFVEDYHRSQAEFREDMASIEDDGFYRMERLPANGRCAAALFGYKGITNYSSMENKQNLRFLQNVGASQAVVWSRYTENLPLSAEALLGIKYILSDRVLPGRESYDLEQTAGGRYLYENPNALPLIFPAEDLTAQPGEDPFENLNLYFASVTGEPEPVFRELPSRMEEPEEEPEVPEPEEEEKPEKHGPRAVYRLKVEADGPVYVHTLGWLQELELLADGQEQTAEAQEYQTIHYLGQWEAGTELELRVTGHPTFDPEGTLFALEDRQVLARAAERIPHEQIRELTSSHLQMDCSLTEEDPADFATTIPYDPAWTVLDNGQPVALKKNWDNFLAFTLEGQGEHRVELLYRPAGLKPGLCLAGISAAVILGGLAVTFLRKKRQK